MFPYPGPIILCPLLPSSPEHQVAIRNENPRLGDDGGRVGDEPVDGPDKPLRLHSDVDQLLPVSQAAPATRQEAGEGRGGGGALGPGGGVEATCGRQTTAAAVIVSDLIRVTFPAHRALAFAVRWQQAGGGGVFVALAAATCCTAGVALCVAVPWAGPQGEMGGQVITLHVGEEHAVLVLQLHYLRKDKGMYSNYIF